MPRLLPALAIAALAVSCSWLLNKYGYAETWLLSLGANLAAKEPCTVVEEGYRVAVDFKLIRDKDGKVLDSSDANGQAMNFICGMGEVLVAMDTGVVGMAVGQEASFPVGGEHGFGSRSEENLVTVGLDVLPEGLEVDKETTVSTEYGERNAVVIALNDTMATLDFNHPWAGLNLTMEVKLLSCEPPPAGGRLVVETISPGDGATYPKYGDKVTVHYIGSMVDTGEQFDSSRDKDKPFEFQIGYGQVIPGLDMGIKKVSLGEKALLKIPSAMAYEGQGGGGLSVKGDVFFEVELLKIN